MAVQTVQKSPGDEKKRKRKKKRRKAARKGPEEHSLAKNKHKILNGGQKRTLLGGPEERKTRELVKEE